MTSHKSSVAKLPKTATEADVLAADLEVRRLTRLRRKQKQNDRQKWVAVIMPLFILVGAFIAHLNNAQGVGDLMMRMLQVIIVMYAVSYVVTLWRADKI